MWIKRKQIFLSTAKDIEEKVIEYWNHRVPATVPEKNADDSISEYHAVICQNCGAMVIGAYDNRYKYCHHNDTEEHRDCLGYLQRI